MREQPPSMLTHFGHGNIGCAAPHLIALFIAVVIGAVIIAIALTPPVDTPETVCIIYIHTVNLFYSLSKEDSMYYFAVGFILAVAYMAYQKKAHNRSWMAILLMGVGMFFVWPVAGAWIAGDIAAKYFIDGNV